MTAGKADFYDKAEAIGEFVQKKIRYFVIEIGVGGFQPHAAGDIFRGRYGDCKDKATLLSAMLSMVGIHSALLMVDTARGVIDPNAPSIVGENCKENRTARIADLQMDAGQDHRKDHGNLSGLGGGELAASQLAWRCREPEPCAAAFPGG